MSTCKHGLSLCHLCGFDSNLERLKELGEKARKDLRKFRTETIPAIEKARKKTSPRRYK